MRSLKSRILELSYRRDRNNSQPQPPDYPYPQLPAPNAIFNGLDPRTCGIQRRQNGNESACSIDLSGYATGPGSYTGPPLTPESETKTGFFGFMPTLSSIVTSAVMPTSSTVSPKNAAAVYYKIYGATPDQIRFSSNLLVYSRAKNDQNFDPCSQKADWISVQNPPEVSQAPGGNPQNEDMSFHSVDIHDVGKDCKWSGGTFNPGSLTCAGFSGPLHCKSGPLNPQKTCKDGAYQAIAWCL